MPPSDSAIRTSGNFVMTRDHSTSAAACTMFIGCSEIITLSGASTEVIGSCDDEPMCRQTMDLVRHQLGIPDPRDRQRDEPARVAAAPLVDVQVVVGPDHRQRDGLVV